MNLNRLKWLNFVPYTIASKLEERMKLPSIIKVPSHKRFEFKYRHFDPIKDDIQNRTDLIKASMERRELLNEDSEKSISSISGAFSRNAFHKESKTGLTRFAIMVSLVFGIFGYIFLGNLALYIFIGLVSGIYILKRKRII